MKVSIIIPTLDEASQLPRTLAAIRGLETRGHEVVVVDGGSTDGTVSLARAAGCRVITAPRGRARQMNVGAREATGEVLVFLHGDTRLPPDALRDIVGRVAGSRRTWGRFDVRIEGTSTLLSVIATFMNARSRLTGIATGDQAIFLTRGAFDRIGGFPDQPLMEDIELSRRLKRVAGRPICLRQRVTTSGRRWETRGPWRTVFLMWRLRFAYWRGAAPETLARVYR